MRLYLKALIGFITNLIHYRHYRRYKESRAENPPIFIVGCGHSGTTLLRAVMAAHSRIYAIPYETCLAYSYDHNEVCLIKNHRVLLGLFDDWTVRAEKMRWCEKTPNHIFSMKELMDLCPGCKFLLIIRDGRDVAMSLQKRTGDIKKGILRWVSANRAGQVFWHHPNVHVMRYEDLIENFEKTMTSALQSIGEKFEEKLHHYYDHSEDSGPKKVEKPDSAAGEEKHRQYREWQVKQPLFDGRLKWKGLSEEDRKIIKEIAGDMLIEYGYAVDKNW